VTASAEIIQGHGGSARTRCTPSFSPRLSSDRASVQCSRKARAELCADCSTHLPKVLCRASPDPDGHQHRGRHAPHRSIIQLGETDLDTLIFPTDKLPRSAFAEVADQRGRDTPTLGCITCNVQQQGTARSANLTPLDWLRAHHADSPTDR